MRTKGPQEELWKRTLSLEKKRTEVLKNREIKDRGSEGERTQREEDRGSEEQRGQGQRF